MESIAQYFVLALALFALVFSARTYFTLKKTFRLQQEQLARTLDAAGFTPTGDRKE